MRLLKTTGLTLLALLALGALGAASASAEEGFLKVGGGHPGSFTTSSGTAILETVGGLNITCTSSTGKGTPTTDKHGTWEIHFLGCKSVGFPVQDLTDKKAEIILITVLWLVCLLPGGGFGIIVEPGTVHLEIPALGILLFVTGSVIGKVLEFNETTAKLSGKVDFVGSKGVQEVTECTDKVVHKLFTEKNESGTKEESSQNAVTGTLTFPAGEEAIIMDS